MNRAMDKRQETVAKLVAIFGAANIAKFAQKSEEKLYSNGSFKGISKEEGLSSIKEDRMVVGDSLSNAAQIHPAWIVKELENESPKVIGIVLRWLPSSHVRFILDNLPKRVKMALPKLVESFSVPAPILRMIRSSFEKKFGAISNGTSEVNSFGDVVNLKLGDLEMLFKDLGIHELALAFNNVEFSAMKVLLNRMSITTARALQQRIKDVAEADESILKDARYTILEVALDQEDIDKLLIDVGLAAFSKAIDDPEMYSALKLKLDPVASYVLKRYVDQYAGLGKLTKERQAIVMDRIRLLFKADILGK